MSNQVKKTLDNFVVGKSNQFAYHMVDSISNSISDFLIFYGETGTGKTHLLQAIKNMPNMQDKNIIYVKSESFLNDFIDNIRNHTMSEFQKKYRHCNFLLIDDIQYLSNKEGTQEELYHTIEVLRSSGKKIVFTSNKHPKHLSGFSSYLKSQLLSALSIKIKSPKKKVIIAIIKQKASEMDICLNEKTIDFIVKNSKKNIYQIESMIMKLKAHSTLFNQDITFKIAKKVLRNEIIKDKDKKQT